jgi:hypothetical protein
MVSVVCGREGDAVVDVSSWAEGAARACLPGRRLWWLLVSWERACIEDCVVRKRTLGTVNSKRPCGRLRNRRGL